MSEPTCPCRCHVYPPGSITCDTGTEQPGGILSCSPCTAGSRPGATGNDQPHRIYVSGRADREIASQPRDEVPLALRCVMPHDEPAQQWIGFACKRHYHELDRRLTEIEELYALRDELILPGPSGDTRHGTRFGSPAPGRIELMQITDRRGFASMDQIDAPGALAGWVRTMFEEREWEPPRESRRLVPIMAGPTCDDCTHASCIVIRNAWRRVHVRCGDWEFRDGAWRLPETVSWLIGVLRRERKWIVAQPWLDAYADELRDVHRAMARATGATMWPEPAGKCPNCQTSLFNDMTGADVVTCRKCKASWSGVAWLRLRLIFESEAK